MDQAGAIAEFAREILGGRAMDIADSNLRALQDLREQPTGAPIHVVDDKNLVAGFQQARDRRDRRQSAGEGKGADAVFQFRELLFEDRARWIPAAGIVVLAEFESAFLLEGRCLINGRRNRAMGIAGAARSLNQYGIDLHDATASISSPTLISGCRCMQCS